MLDYIGTVTRRCTPLLLKNRGVQRIAESTPHVSSSLKVGRTQTLRVQGIRRLRFKKRGSRILRKKCVLRFFDRVARSGLEILLILPRWALVVSSLLGVAHVQYHAPLESWSVIRTRQVLGRQGAMCTLVGLVLE